MFKCLGQSLFTRLRPSLFFLGLFLPFLLAALFLFQKVQEINTLENRCAQALRKERIALKNQKEKEAFLMRYRNSDLFFLNFQIESYPLLQREKNRLSASFSHPAFLNTELMQDRLHFLEKNRLLFKEEDIQSSAEMTETYERQKFSVEMDETDLKAILSILEDLPSSHHSCPLDKTRPQILIQHFHLQKKLTPLQTEVFEINFDLLKRDFS